MISLVAPPSSGESEYVPSPSSSSSYPLTRQFSSLARVTSSDDANVAIVNTNVIDASHLNVVHSGTIGGSPSHPSSSRVSELRQRNSRHRAGGIVGGVHREDEEESGMRHDDSYAFVTRPSAADDSDRAAQSAHAQSAHHHRNRSASLSIPASSASLRTPVAFHALSPGLDGLSLPGVAAGAASAFVARSFLSPSGSRGGGGSIRPPSPLHIQHGLLLADRDRISREQMQLVAQNQLSVHARSLHSQSLSVSGRASANESGATSPASGSRYIANSLSASAYASTSASTSVSASSSAANLSLSLNPSLSTRGHGNSFTSPLSGRHASTASMAAHFYATEVANAAARLRDVQNAADMSSGGGSGSGGARPISVTLDTTNSMAASLATSPNSSRRASIAPDSHTRSTRLTSPPPALSSSSGGGAVVSTPSPYSASMHIPPFTSSHGNGGSAAHPTTFIVRMQKLNRRIHRVDALEAMLRAKGARDDGADTAGDAVVIRKVHWEEKAKMRVNGEDAHIANDAVDLLSWSSIPQPPSRIDMHLSPRDEFLLSVTFAWSATVRVSEDDSMRAKEYFLDTLTSMEIILPKDGIAVVNRSSPNKPIALTIPTTVSETIVAIPVMVKTVPTETNAQIMTATTTTTTPAAAAQLAEVAALSKPPIMIMMTPPNIINAAPPPPLIVSTSVLSSPSHSLLALPSSSSAFTATVSPRASSFLFPLPNSDSAAFPMNLQRSRSLGSTAYATDDADSGSGGGDAVPAFSRSIPSSPSMCPVKAANMVISAFASPRQGTAPNFVPMYNENGVELVQPITINPRTGRPRVLKRFARRYAGLILAHVARENAESATREAMEYRARKKKALEESEMGSGRIPQLMRQQSNLHGHKQTMGAFLTSMIAGNSANKESSEIARSAAAQQRALNDLLGEDPTQRGTEASSGDNSSQIESFHQSGNIFNAILKADRKAVDALLRANPHVLSQRGPVGELPLHMCILYASPAHHVLAFYLMSRCPHVIAECYTGTEYTGENILHIAIIQQDTRMATRLVAKEPLLINATATGAFFSRGQPCYYGEYPLYFACCTGQLAMATLLINAGASMDAADSNGNNALHLMVIHSRPEMYTYVKKCWIERNAKLPHYEQCPPDTLLWKRRNKEGFTPMTLSAKMGNMSMFSFLLEEEKQKQWAYGPISCFVYPLEQIDVPLDDDTKSDHKNAGADEFEQPRALELIVNEAHLDLLMHPRMIELIKQKWERFAARIFFQRFMVVFLYLVLFTATTIHRQTENIHGIEAWAQFEDHLLLYQNQTAHIAASHVAREEMLADLHVHASALYAGLAVEHERLQVAAAVRARIGAKHALPLPAAPVLAGIRQDLLVALALQPLPTLVALDGINLTELVDKLARANEKAASRESAGIAKRRKKVEAEDGDNAGAGAGANANNEPAINISNMSAAALHEMLTPPPMLYDDGVLGELFDLLCDLAVHPPKAWLTIAWQYPILLLIGELIVVGGAMFKGNNEFGEMADRGVNNYFGAAGSAFFENMLSLIFSSLMLIVLVLSMSGSYLVRMFMGLASIIGWSYIFFFLLAFRMTGPMIVMIYQMLTSDVIRFLTVFGVFLVAFAQAFFVLFDGDGFGGFVASVQTCFLAMLGDFQFDDYTASPFKEVSVALLLTYVVVVTILLLNLLVAMMGDTYEKVNEQAEMQWHLERARIIFAIEHEMDSDVRGKKSNKYWTVIGGKRYLQVMVEDPDHFRTKKTTTDA